MNSKIAKIGLSLVTVMMMSACGTDDIVDAIADATDVDAQALEAALEDVMKADGVEYTCTKTQVYDGKTYTSKMGATNKFEIKDEGSYCNLKLANNANELTLASVQTVNVISMQSKKMGTVNATITNKYPAGTETTVGSSSIHGSVNCVTTYDVSSFSTTIYDADSIYNYMWFDDEESQVISDTCPSWMDDDDEEDVISFSSTALATVVDSSSGTSYISEYESMK